MVPISPPVSCFLLFEPRVVRPALPEALRWVQAPRLPGLGFSTFSCVARLSLPHRIIFRLRFPSLAVSVLGLPTFRVSGPLSPSPPRGGSPVHASVLPLVSYSLPVLGRLSYRLIASYLTGCFPFTRLSGLRVREPCLTYSPLC